MIRNLIHVIEQNSDPNPPKRIITFKDYLTFHEVINSLTFSRALQYFETYTRENRIKVGNFMYSVYLLFNSEDEYVTEKSQVSCEYIQEVTPLTYPFEYPQKD